MESKVNNWEKVAFWLSLVVCLGVPGLQFMGIILSFTLGAILLALAAAGIAIPSCMWVGNLRFRTTIRLSIITVVLLGYLGIVGTRGMHQFLLAKGDIQLVREMSNKQLVSATDKLCNQMIDFERKHDEDVETINTKWSAQLASADTLEKKRVVFQKESDDEEVSNAQYRASWQKDYMGNANAVHNEILFRLRLTPEEGELRVLQTYSARQRQFELMQTLPLAGFLSGPEPIAGLADYLHRLAGFLQ